MTTPLAGPDGRDPDGLDPAAGWPEPAEVTGSTDDREEDAELDDLMLRLRTIADTVDAPPSIVTELAYAAFETRDLDAELAVLTADSAVDRLELVRSVAIEPRLVSFETDDVTVEVQIEHTDDGYTVSGLILGAVGTVEVQGGDTRRRASIDERGWFTVDRVPAGPVRLRITAADGRVVTTEWIAG